MLQNHGAVRTLIVWFTLFFAWSASVLWFQGVAMIKFMMSNSSLFAYDLALRSTGTLLPDGIPLMLLTFLVLATGAVLATWSLVAVSLLRTSRRQAAHFSRVA